MYEIHIIDFLIGTGVGTLLGLFIGYVCWKRQPVKMRKGKTITQVQVKRLTQLQLLSFVLFIAYVSTPLFGLPNPDPIIAIGILALVSGESFGGALAFLLERYQARKK